MAPFLITKLGHYDLIIGLQWFKHKRAVVDPIGRWVRYLPKGFIWPEAPEPAPARALLL